MNRRRQEWVEGNCADEKNQLYCDTLQNNTARTTSQPKTTAAPTNNSEVVPSNFSSSPTETIQHPEGVVSLRKNT